MLTTLSPRGANNHFALSIRFSFVWNLEAMFTTGHRVPRKVGSGTTTHFLLQLPPIFFSATTHSFFGPYLFSLSSTSHLFLATTHFFVHYPFLFRPLPISCTATTHYFMALYPFSLRSIPISLTVATNLHSIH